MGRTYYERPKRIEKLSREEKVDLMFDLINSFSKVRNPVETAYFLQDLLTANEIRNLSKRLRIAKLLLAGKSQRDISKEVHASSATINKVNLWLNQGGNGFRKVISRLPIRWAKPTKLPRGPIEFHLPQLLMATSQYIVASKQEKISEEFIAGVRNKELLDRDLRDSNREYYSSVKRKRKKRKF